MRSKLLSLAHGKALAAVAGAALLVGGGTVAAFAATHTHVGLGSLLATSSPAAGAHGNGDHGAGAQGDQHEVAIEGVLKSYTAGASGGTITVLAHGQTTPTTVTLNAKTRVNGEHATSLADLTAAIGHKVEVQATKQSDGTLLAWKVTVQGADPGAHGHGKGHDAGDGHSGTRGDSGEHDDGSGASD